MTTNAMSGGPEPGRALTGHADSGQLVAQDHDGVESASPRRRAVGRRDRPSPGAAPRAQPGVGHGSVSFGHVVAERYGVHQGALDDWMGYAQTALLLARTAWSCAAGRRRGRCRYSLRHRPSAARASWSACAWRPCASCWLTGQCPWCTAMPSTQRAAQRYLDRAGAGLCGAEPGATRLVSR